MSIILFSLFLLFGCKKEVASGVSNTENTDLEMELSQLKSEKYDSLIRNRYEKLIQPYYNKKDTSYYIIAKDFEKNSKSANDTLGFVNAQVNLGQYFYNNFKIDSAYLYYTEAEKFSKQMNEQPFLAAILLNKANILSIVKNFSESEGTAFDALKVSKAKGYLDYEFNCYLIIANSLTDRERNTKALEYYNRALSLAITNNEIFEPSSISQTFSYIAATYQKQNNHQKTIEFVNKGLAYKNLKKEDIKVYCYLKNILAKSIYKTQKQQASSIYTETHKIGDSLDFAPIQVSSQLQLGEYYLFYKDTLKANAYLHKAKELAHQNKIFEDELIILKLLSKSNPAKNYFYTDRYIHLNDSLQAVERATRDKFARIEFETDEISNQKYLIQLENKKLNTQLFLAIGFALFLLLSLYLWFKNRSNKAKIYELKLLQEQQLKDEKIYQLLLIQKDKIEEAKQIEKNRISKELHDGIMGKLAGIRMNLYLIKKKTDPETVAKCLEYVEEIRVIETDLRLLAHDLNKNILSNAQNIEQKIKALMEDYKGFSAIDFELHIEEHILWDQIKYESKINMYRIIQEALQNVHKYAKASKVRIQIVQVQPNISLQIIDNGIGFNPSTTIEGIGLNNMKERAAELGGTITIDTTPKMGTKINLLFPI